MPVKTHKTSKKHPKHFLKVYAPYLPLLVLLMFVITLGQQLLLSSRHGVLSYATSISSTDLLQDTNQQRVNNGDQPLKLSDKLVQAAQAKANDMASRNYWSHNTPEGSPPWIFVDKAGYNYQKAGENLAYGFATSADTVTGWMNSPSHRENLLDKSFTDVGFGYANAVNYQNNGPETIVVAMYGEPATITFDSSIPIAPGSLTPSTNNPVSTNQSNKNQPVHEPLSKTIAKIQALTGGKAPWANFAIGLLSGALIMYLLFKHSYALQRAWRRSERYFVSHPLFDVTLIVLTALTLLLSRGIGVIR